MAASLSTIVAKDGNAAIIVGAIQALDLSGAGTGPWSLAYIIVDGVAGSNRMAVKAASTAPVAGDPAAVVTLSPNLGIDHGSGTGGSATPRVIVDSSQLAALQTTSQVMATGYQLVGLPSNQPAIAVTESGTWTVQPGNTANTTPWLASINAGGNTATVTAGNALKVDGSAVTQPISNAYLTEFGTGYYVAVAASQTATVLQSSAGATGDYISGILVTPATTSPGNVILLDNATSMTVFTGGATSVNSLVPFFIALGSVSRSGAWKLTTGANVSCIAVGKFS